jgi:hypothetical protein
MPTIVLSSPVTPAPAPAVRAAAPSDLFAASLEAVMTVSGVESGFASPVLATPIEDALKDEAISPAASADSAEPRSEPDALQQPDLLAALAAAAPLLFGTEPAASAAPGPPQVAAESLVASDTVGPAPVAPPAADAANPLPASVPSDTDASAKPPAQSASSSDGFSATGAATTFRATVAPPTQAGQIPLAVPAPAAVAVISSGPDGLEPKDEAPAEPNAPERGAASARPAAKDVIAAPAAGHGGGEPSDGDPAPDHPAAADAPDPAQPAGGFRVEGADRGGAGTAGSQPSSPHAAGAVAAVAAGVAIAASARRTRFEVRLDPEELGRVDIRLDVGQDGRLATRLIVDRQDTLDMLRNDSRELARTLQQAGFQLTDGGLAFQLRDGRRERAPDAAPDRIETDMEVAELSPADTIYPRASRAAAGGVDVRV